MNTPCENNCGKEVKQTEGKRKKKFCSDSCRQTHWKKSKEGNVILPSLHKIKFLIDEDGKKFPITKEWIADITTAMESKEGRIKSREYFSADEILNIIVGSPVKAKIDEITHYKAVSCENKNVIPLMPVKEKGEHPIDFCARKNEWKEKYGNK